MEENDWLTKFKTIQHNIHQVAIENNLKVKLVEAFMGDLKDLFEKHNIEVPAEKLDLSIPMFVLPLLSLITSRFSMLAGIPICIATSLTFENT